MFGGAVLLPCSERVLGSNPDPGSFCMEFACFPRGSLYVLQLPPHCLIHVLVDGKCVRRYSLERTSACLMGSGTRQWQHECVRRTAVSRLILCPTETYTGLELLSQLRSAFPSTLPEATVSGKLSPPFCRAAICDWCFSSLNTPWTCSRFLATPTHGRPDSTPR